MSCAKFVIADKFSQNVEKTEEDIKKHFDIESRSEISLNVKHACKLERKRKSENLRKLLSKKCSQCSPQILDYLEAFIE